MSLSVFAAGLSDVEHVCLVQSWPSNEATAARRPECYSRRPSPSPITVVIEATQGYVINDQQRRKTRKKVRQCEFTNDVCFYYTQVKAWLIGNTLITEFALHQARPLYGWWLLFGWTGWQTFTPDSVLNSLSLCTIHIYLLTYLVCNQCGQVRFTTFICCLLYTSDAADE